MFIYPCSTLSIFLNLEGTVFETKNSTVIFHQNWEYLLLFWCIFPRTTILKLLINLTYENILFPIMPMNIATESYLSFFLSFPDQLKLNLNYHFGVVNGRMWLFGRLNPLSVQVCSWKIAPIIPNYNSINV